MNASDWRNVLPARITHRPHDGGTSIRVHVFTRCAPPETFSAARPVSDKAVPEANVSRLHGHSSSSGAQRTWSETDPIAVFEQKLLDIGAIDQDGLSALKAEAKTECESAVAEATSEPEPTREDVLKHTYAPSEVDAVYPEDYTGLPQ